MQEGFQNFADHYEKQKVVPEEFSPFQNAYVHYLVTFLKWNKNFVMFAAKASFSATIDGKNVTFVPNITKIENQAHIPLEDWNMTSLDDQQSHLLQGVRISTEFVNSLMWFASLTNITRYIQW